MKLYPMHNFYNKYTRTTLLDKKCIQTVGSPASTIPTKVTFRKPGQGDHEVGVMI